ncbi:MAG: SPASM domain-containing protein [Ruminococcaceae bacterium]|nr:SPASM domain-containing protein [Oscillospiraceae bacterium]
MRPVSLLIKPVSGACNMECGYCFYRGLPGHNRGVMSLSTAQNIVDAVFDEASGSVSFAFQGGEPTLAGVDFFRAFSGLVKKANVRGLPVSFSLQTNGIVADEELCSFFAREKYLIGISLDGCAEVHDRHRKLNGGATFDKVKAGIDAYRRAGAEVNILTVVTGDLCNNIDRCWRVLADMGLPCLQFILCLEGQDGYTHGCAPTPGEYGRFLVRSFDLWMGHIRAGDYISVRLFDNLVAGVLGYPCELCSQAGICTNQLVVEADGSVYPCDFYVTEENCLGNINRECLLALINSPVGREFVGSRPSSKNACGNCRWFSLCRGGCRREFGSGEKTAWCKAWKHFFASREDELLLVADLVRRGLIKTERI